MTHSTPQVVDRPTLTRKLKVLLLHGYAQSAVAFRSKTGSVRKESKKLADFVFAAAPHPLSAAQLAARRAATKRPASSSSARQIEADDEGVATWWHFDHAAQTYDEASLDASLDALETVFRNEGPFDGVGGFSQGACLSLILASRLQRGLLSERSAIAFDFVMLFSGFLPHDERLTAAMRDCGRLEMPSFHSFGTSDGIITPAQSSAAASIFADEMRTEVTHAGGHLVSSERGVRKGVKSFLTARRLELDGGEMM